MINQHYRGRFFMENKKRNITIIAGIIFLMLVNIGLAIVFCGDSGANIFTTISGWISGIATVVLGLIALWVNAQYKKENDIYLEEQSELQWKEDEKETIDLYRKQILETYNRFLKLNYADVLYQLIEKEDKPEAPIFELALLSKIKCEKQNMFFVFSICRYYFEFKSELFESYVKYLDLLSIAVSDYKKMIYNKEFDKGETLQRAYVNVINNFNIHISNINVFLTVKMNLTPKKELEKVLSEMRRKQADWWNKVKPQTD